MKQFRLLFFFRETEREKERKQRYSTIYIFPTLKTRKKIESGEFLRIRKGEKYLPKKKEENILFS